METINHPHVEEIDWTKARPHPRNARRHNDKKVALLTASILASGVLLPIVIDEDNFILAGHARWEVAKRRGWKLPAIRAAHLTEAEKRAFLLADNHLQEMSTYDDATLQEELEFLFENGNLEITGFTTADLDFSVVEQPQTKAERVELPLAGALATSRFGDLWLVGEHRLLCGDGRDPNSWERVLDGEVADLVCFDPPYNIAVNGFVSGTGRFAEFEMASGEMTPPEFTAFLRSLFRNCVRFAKDGSIHYVFQDWRHIREILDAADGVYDQFKQMIVWDKGVGGQGAFYRSQYELVLVFKAGKAKHTNTFGLGETGRYRTNLVRHQGVNGFRKGRKADLESHPTVKPTALIADFILDCSHRGELVVDPCVGSGTTLLGAHRCHRRGAAIEIDPLYTDVALSRLSALSGLTPTLAGDGRTFDEIAAFRKSEAEG